MAEIRRKVADSLPHRLGFLRGAVLEPIDQQPRSLTAPELLTQDTLPDIVDRDRDAPP